MLRDSVEREPRSTPRASTRPTFRSPGVSYRRVGSYLRHRRYRRSSSSDHVGSIDERGVSARSLRPGTTQTLSRDFPRSNPRSRPRLSTLPGHCSVAYSKRARRHVRRPRGVMSRQSPISLAPASGGETWESLYFDQTRRPTPWHLPSYTYQSTLCVLRV